MRLIDDRQEKFATAVAAGLSLSEAARRAGYPKNGIGNTGSRLAKGKRVAARIAELRHAETPDSNNNPATKPWITLQLIDIVENGKATQDLAAANRALELLARLGGFLVDRKESYSENVNVNLLDQGQLNQALRSQLAELPEATRVKLLEAAPADVVVEMMSGPQTLVSDTQD